MRDELLGYYERELTYLRRLSKEFAAKYPKVASRLSMSGEEIEDPHVERILEGFSFLTARVHLKIDDEFPEITESLLGVVYPHFIRPIPSMSIVQMDPDPEQGKLSSGVVIPRGSTLNSRDVGGVPCKFRTAYDTTLWPFHVGAAEWKPPDLLDPPVPTDAIAAVRLELQLDPDVSLGELDLSSVRFHLSGENRVVHRVYELLCNRLVEVLVRDPSPGSRIPAQSLPPSAIRPVGFEPDEGLLPYPKKSFIGYRLLQEFFTFPDKFFFVDLQGLDTLGFEGFKDKVEIVFLISGIDGDEPGEVLRGNVKPSLFRLSCTPVVNLFPQQAEPILLEHKKFDYPVIPDVRRPLAVEVFSVDAVEVINAKTQEATPFQPFYSFRHGQDPTGEKAFWVARRTESLRQHDLGTDVHLTLTDLTLKPVSPNADTLTVWTTCTNRDLPGKLPFGNPDGDFKLEGGVSIKRIVCLKKPTAPIRPPMGKAILWRMISHLSLNYLSIVEDGREGLQHILRLYDFTDSAYVKRMINGVTRLDSSRHFAPVLSEHGVTFCQGAKVELELDEEEFVGGGVYLFASVIERFLGLYASLNSFTQLTVSTKQKREALREWKPRTGHRILA